MTETWLRTNRRALAFGIVPPLLIAAIGLRLALGSEATRAAWVFWFGGAMALFGVAAVAMLAWQMCVPRISYRDGQLYFRLQNGPPLAVPADVVEAFFIGQQSLDLPGRPPGRHATVNLVARVAQNAAEWRHRDVKPALGRWSDGYIVVNGTWCEPIDGELIRRLNHRLREIRDQRRSDG